MFSDNKSVQNLVVDSCAFIKNIKIENMGEKLYSVDEVASEIRDKATRKRLEVLPYDLHFKQPCTEDIHIVTQFSKKTGDYISLSATDLKLIALCYSMEKEINKGDISHLKTEPCFGIEIMTGRNRIDNVKNVVGFHSGKPKAHENSEKSVEDSAKVDEITSEFNEKVVVKDDSGNDSESTSEDESDSDSSDDDADWISPENLADVLKQHGLGIVGQDQHTNIPVACLTTDFAMQNVLLHMGMKVISMDGFLIQRLKSYVLRCHACFKTTSIMTKRFCPECGNETLDKVSVTVDELGKMQYHYGRKVKKVNRAVLPPPKGGKHSFNPITAADQTMPKHQLSKKAIQKLDPLHPDYMAYGAPFAQRDLTSRSAVLGIGCQVGRNNRNPNESRNGKKRGGKRR